MHWLTCPGLSILLLLISYVLPFSLAGHLDWMPCIRDSVPSKPLLVAHRGAVGLAPENTKMAFSSAVSSGSYGLESDLQVSKVSFSGVGFIILWFSSSIHCHITTAKGKFVHENGQGAYTMHYHAYVLTDRRWLSSKLCKDKDTFS